MGKSSKKVDVSGYWRSMNTTPLESGKYTVEFRNNNTSEIEKGHFDYDKDTDTWHWHTEKVNDLDFVAPIRWLDLEFEDLSVKESVYFHVENGGISYSIGYDSKNGYYIESESSHFGAITSKSKAWVSRAGLQELQNSIEKVLQDGGNAEYFAAAGRDIGKTNTRCTNP